MISDVYLDHSTYAEPPSRLGACKFVLDLCSFVKRQGKHRGCACSSLHYVHVYLRDGGSFTFSDEITVKIWFSQGNFGYRGLGQAT